MGGALDSNCRKKEKSHTEICGHMSVQTSQSSCITTKAVWKLSYMYYITGIPSTSVYEKERETMWCFHSSALFWVPREPLSMDWLEPCVDKNQGTKRTFHQLYSLSNYCCSSNSPPFFFYFSHSCCSSHLFHQRAEPDFGLFSFSNVRKQWHRSSPMLQVQMCLNI